MAVNRVITTARGRLIYAAAVLLHSCCCAAGSTLAASPPFSVAHNSATLTAPAAAAADDAAHAPAMSSVNTAASPESEERGPAGALKTDNSGRFGTPLVLGPAYFGATGATARANSSWGVATTHAPQPENTRSLTFWGHFVGPCARTVWGFTASHSLPGSEASSPVYYPQCSADGMFGPSFEANVIDADGSLSHLVRTVASAAGPFAQYSFEGQNPSGANKYIAATYTDFNPAWGPSAANRMRPWGGAKVGSAPAAGELRTQIRASQSVTQAAIPQPAVQQLQQDLNVVFIQERCDGVTSRSFCQINFNIKTFIAGRDAYSPSSDATAFNDNGQGGLIAVVGPINEDGKPTAFHNGSGVQRDAWTSRGAPMQSGPFGRRAFRVEITWSQFEGVLLGVTGGEPATVFGEGWATPSNWVLLRAGYGQENYNNGSSTSTIEGSFASLEVASMGALKTDDVVEGGTSPPPPNPYRSANYIRGRVVAERI